MVRRKRENTNGHASTPADFPPHQASFRWVVAAAVKADEVVDSSGQLDLSVWRLGSSGRLNVDGRRKWWRPSNKPTTRGRPRGVPVACGLCGRLASGRGPRLQEGWPVASSVDRLVVEDRAS